MVFTMTWEAALKETNTIVWNVFCIMKFSQKSIIIGALHTNDFYYPKPVNE